MRPKFRKPAGELSLLPLSNSEQPENPSPRTVFRIRAGSNARENAREKEIVMTAVGAVDHTPQSPPGVGATHNRSFGGPSIDTDPPGTTSFPRSTEAQLPPAPAPTDPWQAQAAIHAIWQNVGVDYARIAALMILIDSELARAARDMRVTQIEAIARQMHTVADRLRNAATLALAGGVVSSGLQIASAGINIGGGIYGMSLTKTTMTATKPSTEPPAAATATDTAATPPPTPPPAAQPATGPSPNPPPPNTGATATPETGVTPPGQPATPETGATPPGQPATPETGATPPGQPDTPEAGATPPGQPDTPEAQAITETPDAPPSPEAPPPETPAENPTPGDDPEPSPGEQPGADEAATELEEAEQLARTRGLDHTLSQLMSARSQNVVLISQGLSMLTSSTGELIRTVLDHESKQMEADVKEDEAKAEEQRSYMENTRAFGDSMQKSAHDMLQVLQQMQEGMHQTTRSIWSRA